MSGNPAPGAALVIVLLDLIFVASPAALAAPPTLRGLAFDESLAGEALLAEAAPAAAAAVFGGTALAAYPRLQPPPS